MTWHTEADVEAAAQAIWADRYPASPWDIGAVEMHLTMRGHARAALAAIPNPRAAGFIAARDEIYTETARMWPEAVDLLDYIAALKPEDKP